MDEREKMIRLWFSMWLEKKDLGIDDILVENVIYTESWGPCYRNREIVKHWFQEWNTRGSVIAWDIKQFFHKKNQTVVEWYFKNVMDNGDIENKIQSLKEFGCNLHNYNPYQRSDMPQFREEKINWF